MRKSIKSTFPTGRQSLLAARLRLKDGTVGVVVRDLHKGNYEMLVKGVARLFSESEVAVIGDDVKFRTGKIAAKIGATYCPMSQI